ncbi:MAG: Lpg1974 family pore-forming outer membrane protein [Gemmataceae bacterium]|nr:Lpg1974 family pore-forming outer membrane protein [Gemmataceae bacterium]MDW8266333.1 Lpg1974 family pore-forming outer membrane protein [Gemmataceae bacterium]
MLRRPEVVLGVLIATGAWCGVGHGQQGGPAIVSTISQPPPPESAPPPAPLPGPAVEDRNGPLLLGDPLLDPPMGNPSGLYFAAEVGLLSPCFCPCGMQNLVNVGGLFLGQVRLPSADLDWTASPQVELGYRFGQGFGAVVMTYRGLVTDGAADLFGFDPLGPARLTSRLDLQIGDLDYANQEWSLGPWWDMRWRIGGRLTNLYFDTRAQGFFLGQRAASHYLGGGPHAGLELARRFGTSGLALFAKGEGSCLFGRLSQSFAETLSLGPMPFLGGATNEHESQALASLRLQAGFSWAPTTARYPLRFSGGYEIEQWWYIGQASPGTNELNIQGLFLRCEFGF